METGRNKYDTNPLDPDVEKKAGDSWGDGSGGAQTQQVRGTTREVSGPADAGARSNVYSEAPTRRYDNVPLEAPYPSVFIPPTYAPPTQQPPRAQPNQVAYSTRPSSRTISGLGMPENWAMILPYAPYLGIVVSLLELFLVPRREPKIRFYASQALALHIAILLIQSVFSVIRAVTDSSFGGALFKLAAFVFLIVSMVRIWRGEPHRIEPLAEPAQWFNQHIEPRNQS